MFQIKPDDGEICKNVSQCLPWLRVCVVLEKELLVAKIDLGVEARLGYLVRGCLKKLKRQANKQGSYDNLIVVIALYK